MRVGDEARWRGHSALGTAVVAAAFWILSWLLGQPVRPGPAALALLAVAAPTLLVGSLASGRRVRETLRRTLPPPRASVYETLASSRDRRMRLAGVVLTGIVALMLFDHFTGGGGVMAGLVTGLMGALGAVDVVEARAWEQAERERESRLYALVRPDGLSPRLGAQEIYEAPRPGTRREGRVEPSPFDLGI